MPPSRPAIKNKSRGFLAPPPTLAANQFLTRPPPNTGLSRKARALGEGRAGLAGVHIRDSGPWLDRRGCQACLCQRQEEDRKEPETLSWGSLDRGLVEEAS